MTKFYITTPIYYVNAEPHIGHLYTTIAADVFSNYYRLKLGEKNVFFLTGTDEHGSKIKEKADAANMSPQNFTDEVAQKFKNTWSEFDISYNKFIRTTDKAHRDYVSDFIVKLNENSALYEDDYEGLYCIGCEKFITEKELLDGKCPDHLVEPQIIKEKNWFFDLNKYLPKIKELIENDTIKIQPAKSKSEVLGLIKQGIPNFSVSREKEKVQWGIPLPWDESQLIYVWCDALTNYISAVDGQGWWPADIHLLGRDILKFHALYWPAMLLAAQEELPKELFIHGFFTVNGQKMSKSLGNVIDPIQMKADFGLDATKYLLLSQFPFGQDGDIEANNFIVKYNADLANGLGNLFNRVLTLAEKFCDNKIPERQGNKDLENLVAKSWEDYIRFMEQDRRIDKCLIVVRDLVAYCDKLISDVKLWEIVKQDLPRGQAYLYNLLETLSHISWMLMPFMEQTAIKIQEQIAVKTNVPLEQRMKWQGLEPGDSLIRKDGVLFARKQ